jgi:hypothetical protein
LKANKIGLSQGIWDFICHNKKWWLTPILVITLLVILSSDPKDAQ